MASSSAPDPRSFDSWSQAFDYPIPTTRQLERRLRADAANSSTKLRDLVGASYRDLLDTANSIVEIHGQSEQVERLLRKIGGRLDVRGIERGAQNIEGWRHARGEADGRPKRLRRAAMLGLLRGAVAYVASVVRGELEHEGVLLVAAKVLIIGRLVGKALSDDSASGDEKEAKVVAMLGKRLAAERNKLLAVIDRRLASIKADDTAANTSTLVTYLGAFALATRSTPTQVLHHFQTVRLDAISRHRESTAPGKSSLVKKLNLLLRTMRDSRAVFVDLMAASLKSLATGPLLQDPSVKDLEQLGLDINELWIDQDIRHFTPWTRHDELTKAKAEQMQKSWAKHALTALSGSIAIDLNRFDDIQFVVDARKMVLQTWLSNRQYARHLDSRQALDQLRRPFQSRIIALLSKRFSDLDLAVREPLADLLDRPDSIELPASLWSVSIASQEIDRGATIFKSNIISAHKGHTPFITSLLGRFDVAAESIAQAQTLVKQMRDTRWDDDYDDYDDSETEADALTGASSNSAQEALGNVDPQYIHAALAEATTRAYAALDAFFAAQVSGSADASADLKSLRLACNAPNAPGIVVLRVLNELRARAPRDTAGTFSPRSSQLLHSAVAEHVASRTAPVLAAALARTYLAQDYPQGSTLERALKTFALPLLWDNGEPPLPIQPSPAPVRVLRCIVREMESLGVDLWSARDGVWDLKRKIISLVEAEADRCVVGIQQAELLEPSSIPDAADQPEKSKATGDEEDINDQHEDEDMDKDATAAKTDNDATVADKAGEVETTTQDNETTRIQRHAEQKQQRLTQLLFDLLYLQRALAVGIGSLSGSESTQSATVPSSLFAALEFAKGGKEIDRLRKSAQEYWKRTYLLFGLLA